MHSFVFNDYSYPQTDVVIICYNVMVPNSLQNVSAKWIHEVREHMPNRPILLGEYHIIILNLYQIQIALKMNGYHIHSFQLIVATQRDRRDEMTPGEVGKCCSTAEGQKVADDLELVAFIETSALKDPEVLDHNLYNTNGSIE